MSKKFSKCQSSIGSWLEKIFGHSKIDCSKFLKEFKDGKIDKIRIYANIKVEVIFVANLNE